MTQVTQKMIQRGHVILISEDPLTLQGKTSCGIRFLRDTNVIGLSGYIGIRQVTMLNDTRR